MIGRLVVFGGTGDLTGRYLLPALVALRAGGHLPDGFEVVGAGRYAQDDEAYRGWAADWLDRGEGDLDAGAVADVLDALRYRRLDLADPASVEACVAGPGPVAVYLALPPAVFAPAISALQRVGLTEDSRLVLEKPFGESLGDAQELNRLLAEALDERQVFRVDHFLAMSTVQNVLGARLANRVLEPILTGAHVDEVEIVWDETLTIEGRAGFYDGVGALKDVIQNHLLQVLCLVAMEPPISLDERHLRDRKVDVLRSVRPLTEEDVAAHTRRARYRAGRIGDRDVPAYADEEGVDAGHGTETFAEVVLELDAPRWAGTRFRLRTTKAVGADRKEVVVRFRPVPHHPFAAADPQPGNVLRFGLEPEHVTLELTGTGPGAALDLVPLRLSAELPPPELPAYARVLLDVLRGDPTLSVRADEAEESWRVVAPILDGWARDLRPLEEYGAGSQGP